MYSLRLALLRAAKPCLCPSRASGGVLQSLSCSKRPSRLISTECGSIFRISGKETNLYTNFCPITFLMMFCEYKRRQKKKRLVLKGGRDRKNDAKRGLGHGRSPDMSIEHSRSRDQKTGARGRRVRIASHRGPWASGCLFPFLHL